MIDHEWLTEVTGDLREQLHRLLTDAAREDAEAGFPSFSLDDEVPPGTRHLLIWLLPDERSGRDEPPPTLAGCLRLEPSSSTDRAGSTDGSAEVRLVIDPELRSRGISTSLCEQLGLDTGSDGGWAGTGYSRLHCWARGDHPAAQRMSLRFSDTSLRRARREWRLLALLRRPTAAAATEAAATTDVAAAESAAPDVHGVEPGTPGLDRLWRNAGRSGSAPKDGRVLIVGSEDVPAGAAWFDAGAAEPTEFGPAGLLRAVLVDTEQGDSSAVDSSAAGSGRFVDSAAGTEGGGSGRFGEEIVAPLLAAAMTALREQGSRVAVITVADHEESLLTACRHAGFQHDQTDCEYVLG